MATVELALVLPIVLLFLFGIIEFGMLFKDSLMLQNGARAGAREACVGSTPSRVQEAALSAARSLDADKLDVVMEYRARTGSGWSEWMPLELNDDGTANNAPRGAQIRVQLSYTHSLLTGGLFSWLATDPETNSVSLTASSVARRE